MAKFRLSSLIEANCDGTSHSFGLALGNGALDWTGVYGGFERGSRLTRKTLSEEENGFLSVALG